MIVMHKLSWICATGALGIGLALAGCGDDGKRSSGPAAPASAAQTLRLSADPDGALKFDKAALTADAGTVRIVMDNPSTLAHGVGVEGSGIDEEGTTVDQGGTSTVTATLKSGTYKFYCTVASHRQAGMAGKLTVR
jgi:plastocyanin